MYYNDYGDGETGLKSFIHVNVRNWRERYYIRLIITNVPIHFIFINKLCANCLLSVLFAINFNREKKTV